MRDLDSIIKAYDVRGIYPDQFDEALAHDVGASFVRVLGVATAQGGPGAVVIGHDMRPSGPDLVASFADGVREQGCDVILIGLCSTDGLYFASGSLGLPGAMFTASHNPAEYNGIKLCRVGAAPVGQDTGLADIKQMIRSGIPESDETMGEARSRDTLADYAGYLRKLVELSGIRPLTVVVDAGNGMAGYTVPAVLGEEAGLPALPMSIDRMYFELDGTFPNHEANPIEPKNLVDIQARVRSIGADIGLAFDGDADRCFVIDEGGRIVDPSPLTPLIAARELRRSPDSTIIHNLITSKAVPEVVFECGGSAVKTRVGHSFIKATMAETDAVFGGEHSGHFYFRDFWRADSGMLAAMHTLAALGSTPEGTTISSLLTEFERYVASGEINTPVEDQSAMMELIEATFTGNNDVTTDHMDGLTVDGGQWWFNVRPSNTEPLLRLNVEAREADTMETLRDEVLALMRGGAT